MKTVMKNKLLPTDKSVPETDIKKYLILIYGKPKIGKTTLAAQFDDPLFLMFEGGAKSLSVYKTDINKWEDLKDVISELKKTSRYKTVVLDTYARAYELCMDYVCKEMDIDHPTDAGYGKGWDYLRREFVTQIGQLTVSNRGVILLCHATEKDIEQPDGTVKTMTAPDCSKQAMALLNREVDLYAYYYYGQNGKRYIRVKATDDVVAGNRINGHFGGISKFSAGSSPEEAYTNLINAFNNKVSEEKQMQFKIKK